MTWWSRRVSPVRFLLCAVFMGIAFILASWTSARADDKGLLASVTESVPPVGQVVEKVSAEVVSTTAAVPVVDLKPVVTPVVEKVDKAVEKPVAQVDRTTTEVVEKTSKTLSDTTVRVTDTVKDIAPVSVPVVDPVVEVVVPEVSVEDPVSVPAVPAAPDVPAVVDDVVDGLEPVRVGASGSGAPSAEVGSTPRASTPPALPTTSRVTATVSEKPSAAAVVDVDASIVGAQANISRAAGHSPAKRLPVGPPAGPLAVSGGTSPAPGGGSSSGGLDAGLTPSSFELPLLVPFAVSSEQSCHAPGPCPDPGSRPG